MERLKHRPPTKGSPTWFYGSAKFQETISFSGTIALQRDAWLRIKTNANVHIGDQMMVKVFTTRDTESEGYRPGIVADISRHGFTVLRKGQIGSYKQFYSWADLLVGHGVRRAENGI